MVSHLPYGESRQRTIQEHKDLGDHPPFFMDPSDTSSCEEHVCCAAEDVEGSWELIFSTQLKSGYMPIRELVGFYPSREEASIDATAGPLPIGG